MSMPYHTSSRQLRVDAGRLWSGGAATALVAVGVTIVATLALRAVMNVSVFAAWEDEITLGYELVGPSVAAVAAALAATGMLHLLMYSTPRAPQFFTWIASLFVAAFILQVFLSGTSLANQLVTSALYLLVGIAITSLLQGVARTAVRYERAEGHREHRTDGYRDYRSSEGHRPRDTFDDTLPMSSRRNHYRG